MRRFVPLVLLFAVVMGASACQKEPDPANPKEMKAKLESKVRMALWKVDATTKQEKQVDAMLDVLSVDLYGFQEENNGIKRRIIGALGGESVDQAGLDKVQKDALALFDRYTQRMMVAATDLSKVLTPEQRQKLVNLWREWEFSD